MRQELRRAAAVTLILPVRKGNLLTDVFEIADSFLQDKDIFVQKGYGWMLKEASHLHQQDVFDYVIRNKRVMDAPHRLTLRHRKNAAGFKTRGYGAGLTAYIC